MRRIARSNSVKDVFRGEDVSTYRMASTVLATVSNVGRTNGMKYWWQTIIRAWHGGIFIGLGAGIACILAGSLESMQVTGSLPISNDDAQTSTSVDLSISIPLALKKFASGGTFPIGLFFIVLTGSELFTGNVMFLFAAYFENLVSMKRVLQNLILSYFGNIAGTLTAAYFLFHLTELVTYPSIQTFLFNNAEHIVYQSTFGVNVLKGIGDNYLVSLALWCACSSDDVTGKIIAMWWAVMAFVVIGFEHCIATTVFVPLAIMEGAPIPVNDYIVKSLIPVTIGNIIGGFLFILTEFFMYGMEQEQADSLNERINYYLQRQWLYDIFCGSCGSKGEAWSSSKNSAQQQRQGGHQRSGNRNGTAAGSETGGGGGGYSATAEEDGDSEENKVGLELNEQEERWTQTRT